MEADGEPTIVHLPEQSRYEIFVGDRRCGHADYVRRDAVMTMTHTLTDPAMRGRGLAGRLVQHALDDARSAGLQVVPQCWYVGTFIDQHPEYSDLLQPPRSAAAPDPTQGDHP